MVSLLLVGCCPLSCMHAERGLLQGCFGLWASFISGGLYRYISYPSPEDIGAPWQHPSPGLRAPRTRASRVLASARRSLPLVARRACWPPPPELQRAAASHAAHAHHARSSAPSQRLPAQEQRKTEGKRKEQNQNFEPKLLFQTLNQSK